MADTGAIPFWLESKGKKHDRSGVIKLQGFVQVVAAANDGPN